MRIPMVHFFAAGASAVQKALERVCPGCGLQQKVATHQLTETVPCKQCGTPMPRKENA
ncbi:MAG: hypothetical protein HYX28_00095 [Candidatus Koribacter versatilis]|uniref:Uncharacterized protein n=1 Tax=Candidatus Korobacter versatilis TaxID=658062 RepID=A0A932A6N6_9BACT|nr:hypothetical protein [Candidatus Koribacter versatilis]